MPLIMASGAQYSKIYFLIYMHATILGFLGASYHGLCGVPLCSLQEQICPNITAPYHMDLSMEPLTIWKLAEEHEYQEAWIIGSILGTKP